MIPSLFVVVVLAGSAFATSFISGILGMAGGMILMGVLLALLPLPAAMLLHGLVQLAANGWRAFLLRTAIDWRVFGGYAIGACIALALFAVLQVVVAKPLALLAMGATPFIALALPERMHLNVERRGHSLVCGFVCVALSLTAGIAGPILDVFFVRSKMTRHRVVATKAITQSLTHLLKVFYFGALTVTGAAISPWLAVTMVLLAFAGTSLSRQVLERISDAVFRRWTRWTVTALGLVYLASGARLLLA